MCGICCPGFFKEDALPPHFCVCLLAPVYVEAIKVSQRVEKTHRERNWVHASLLDTGSPIVRLYQARH